MHGPELLASAQPPARQWNETAERRPWPERCANTYSDQCARAAVGRNIVDARSVALVTICTAGGAAVTIYQVVARPWEHGWELHIDGVGVTQSGSLADAERMVRDYIATEFDDDAAANAQIELSIDDGHAEA